MTHLLTRSRGSGSTQNNGPRIIEEGRNQPQIIHLHIESNDSHIVKVVTKDYQSNGNIKVMMDNGGTLAAA